MNSIKTYNIEDFGARTCDWLQTEQIQAAIDECFKNGGGRVVIPKGIFRTACIRLRSNVNLHLESGAILMGSTDPEDYNNYMNDTVEPIVHWSEDDPYRKNGGSVYPFSRWCNAIVRAYQAHNISVTGDVGSYIDGMNVYDAKGEESYRGPHGLCFWCCENIYLEGYTIKDCANWAHAIFRSQNITCRNVTVYGGHDAFDVRTCDNVLVEDCLFRCGDDCVAGFDNHDVVVRRCTFDSSCNALRFGGNNVLVEDCTTVYPTSFAHRYTLTDEKKKLSAQTDLTCRHNMGVFFVYYCDFRAEIRKTPGDILIRNCKIDSPVLMFSIGFDGKHQWCCNRSLKSIRFENCEATGLSWPINIYGDANEPIIFELENVKLGAGEKGKNSPIIKAWNFEKISLKNVTVEGYTDPTIEKHTEGEVITDNESIKITTAAE